MRIIAGQLKGRTFESPPRGHVRPMQDKIKSALFNMLGEQIVDAVVLDLFAGSGSFGVEALSRGAAHVTFVEADIKLAQLLNQNLQKLGLERQSLVLHQDALEAIEELAEGEKMFDLIFSDPPYGQGLANLSLLKAVECAILAKPGMMITETYKKEELPEVVKDMVIAKRRLYGGTAVCFYHR